MDVIDLLFYFFLVVSPRNDSGSIDLASLPDDCFKYPKALAFNKLFMSNSGRFRELFSPSFSKESFKERNYLC